MVRVERTTGLLTSPDWSPPPYGDCVPLSLEFYCVGLNEGLVGEGELD